MTEREARMVAAIGCTADDGCKSCGASIIGQLTEAFPEHERNFEEARGRWFEAGRPGILGGKMNFDKDGWPL